MKRSLVLDTERDTCYVDDAYEINLTAFLSKLDITTPHLGQLPPVVRYISPWGKNKKAVVVIEGKPHIRTVSFLGNVYQIPVPWFHVVVLLTLLDDGRIIADLNSDVFISFSKTKLENMDHIFYPCYFYNVSEPYKPYSIPVMLGGSLCNGTHSINLKDNLHYYPGIKMYVEASKTDARLVIADLKDFYNLFTDILFSTTFNEEILSPLSFILEQQTEEGEEFNDEDDWYDSLSEKNVYSVLHDQSIEYGIAILDKFVSEMTFKVSEMTFKFKDIVDTFEAKIDSFSVKNMFAIASEMAKSGNPILKRILKKKAVEISFSDDTTSMLSSSLIAPSTSTVTANTNSISLSNYDNIMISLNEIINENEQSQEEYQEYLEEEYEQEEVINES